MQKKDGMNRRSFIKAGVAGACGSGVFFSKSGRTEPVQKQSDDDVVMIRDFRTLGRTGFKVSDVGFGAGMLTEPSVLDAALKAGVNYIDTAEHYKGGQSETAVGSVLGRFDRKKLFLTTKLNIRLGASSKEGLKERFHKCLERLKTEYVDCLMIHMSPVIEDVTNEAFHTMYEELKAEQKVRFLGISNHGTEHSIWGNTSVSMEDVICAAADDGCFDVVLFVYNFLQKEQGNRILAKCKEKNVGTTLMKMDPVLFFEQAGPGFERFKKRGGESEKLERIMDEYKSSLEKVNDFRKEYGLSADADIHAAALKFALSHPDVHSICPSFTNFDHINEFIALSGQNLTDEDKSMLYHYENGPGSYYCRHACGECEPSCPRGVPVNTVMRYNHYFEAHGRQKHAMEKYAKLAEKSAELCIDCDGRCQKNCPHGVPIQGMLLHAHNNLAMA